MEFKRVCGGSMSDERDDTEAILSRRNFLIKAALASTGLVIVGVSGEACACLSPEPTPDADADSDAPQPCLSPPADTAETDIVDEDQPQPCLSPPPADVVDEDQPQICLSAPIDDVPNDGDLMNYE